MTQQHPITPPPELVQQWWEESNYQQHTGSEAEEYVVSMAAQWGADQVLEACCEWLNRQGRFVISKELRAALRPKPPSLKEQALDELHISFDRGYLKKEAADTIRRALEQLDD